MYLGTHLTAVLSCRELSWEAATERMLGAAEMGPRDWPKAASKVAEATLFSAYNAALGDTLLDRLGFCLQLDPCWLCAVPWSSRLDISQVVSRTTQM